MSELIHPPVVLTLWQPWATLYAFGLKQNETRPKKTSYRGTILVHAAKRFTKLQKQQCNKKHFKEALQSIGINKPEELPTGAILGAVDLLECVPVHNVWQSLTDSELAFGDYKEGRFAWLGQNHRVLKNPIPYKNGQGYYLRYKGDFQELSELLPEEICDWCGGKGFNVDMTAKYKPKTYCPKCNK